MSPSDKGAQRKDLRLERKLFRLTIIIYASLFVCAFIPLFGLFIYIPFECAGLLWCYYGFVTVCITFPIVFIVTKYHGAGLLTATASAFRWSVITFGALGLVLSAAVFTMPGYRAFTRGYWLHAKIWLSVPQVREWAKHEPGTTGPRETVPFARWPTTLKIASLGEGEVRIDPETKTVMLVDGGGFGHWGIRVGPAEAVEGHFRRSYRIDLQSGAWVWHEIQ